MQAWRSSSSALSLLFGLDRSIEAGLSILPRAVGVGAIYELFDRASLLGANAAHVALSSNRRGA